MQTSGKVKHNEQSIDDTNVQGITPTIATIVDTDLTLGRMLNDTDLTTTRRSRWSAPISLSTCSRQRSAGPGDPHRRLDVSGDWSRQEKGQDAGQSADNYVLIPITVYLKKYGSHKNSIGSVGEGSATGVHR